MRTKQTARMSTKCHKATKGQTPTRPYDVLVIVDVDECWRGNAVVKRTDNFDWAMERREVAQFFPSLDRTVVPTCVDAAIVAYAGETNSDDDHIQDIRDIFIEMNDFLHSHVFNKPQLTECTFHGTILRINMCSDSYGCISAFVERYMRKESDMI